MHGASGVTQSKLLSNMKNFLLILSLSAFFLLSCNPKTTQKVTTQEPSSEPTPNTPSSETNTPVPPIKAEKEPQSEEEKLKLVASIQKTPCYGECPVFEAKIYSDGTMTWYGKKYVEKEGHYEAMAPADFMAKIRDKAVEVKYFVLSPTYPTEGRKITDLPNTVTYLQLNGKEKKIVNNHHAPKELKAFEAFLMEMVKQAAWKKVGAK